MGTKIFLFIIFIFTLQLQDEMTSAAAAANGPRSGNQNAENVIRRSQVLSPHLQVWWTVDFEVKSIEFKLQVETEGFVLFGLSRKGGVNGADVIVYWKDPHTGLPYFYDEVGTSATTLKVDDHQDWFLLEAREIGTNKLELRFNRSLDTCDREDTRIDINMVRFIWSVGDNKDKIPGEIGEVDVYALDPPMESGDLSRFEIWDLVVNTTMPATKTSYWCTIHKSPGYTKKHHIVGYQMKTENPEALKFNHHMIFHRCLPTPGSPEGQLLEKQAATPGGLCYFNDGTMTSTLMTFCQSYVFGWAIGGDALFFPPDIGLPLNEHGVPEYYAVELHRNNPNKEAHVTYETGIKIYVTPDLRPKEAGILVMGHLWNPTLVIPPKSDAFTVVGHCSPNCTSSQIPPDGITVFNALLHSHLTGRQMKIRHFRPDPHGYFKERPWISSDNNYDFGQQKNRPLRHPVKILPGDHLTFECVYNTSGRQPPSVTVGGLPTTEEMCATYMFYYPRLENGVEFCGSQQISFPPQRFGVTGLDLSGDATVIKSPPELAGSIYEDYLTKTVNWTPDLRAELQETSRFGPHMGFCARFTDLIKVTNGSAKVSFEHTILGVHYPTFYQQFEPADNKCCIDA